MIRIAAILAVLVLAPLLGGCAMFLAGAAGAVIYHEWEKHAPPRGYHWCYQAGGGAPVICRNRYRGRR
jgi:hypothetical protein